MTPSSDTWTSTPRRDCEVLAWSLLALRVPASERLLERVGVESVANDAGDVEYVVHKPIDV